VGNITFNPNATTGVNNAFNVSSGGYVQGTSLADPANRYNLEGGVVNSTQSTPLWGGLPLALAVPTLGSNAQGPLLNAAGSLAAINAWSLFDMASAGIITPTSNVPLYTSGTSLNFARPGSNLRIVVPVYASDVNGLQGAAPNVALYWDPTNLRLTSTAGSNYGPLPIQLEFIDTTSETVSYNSGTGAANWVYSSSVAIVRI
jgi:hypothetical protein